MKRAKQLIALCLVLLVVVGCSKKKNTTTTPVVTPYDSLAHLLAYKASAHPIYVGFLVADGNDPVPSYNPANVPDSVEYVEFL